MELSEQVQTFLCSAPCKAIGTDGDAGLNVVPVSAIKVTAESIQLYDFFMNKTAINLKVNGSVSLAAWEGLRGVQIRAQAQYCEEGVEFDSVKSWAQKEFPERTLKGLIILTPKEIHDVSVGDQKVLV